MPLLAWRNKTAPALVPYYDEAQGVVLLRVVKKAQRRAVAIQVPSKLTSTTVASHESYSSSQLLSEHGLYSSEGEAVQSFPVEMQTECLTSKSNTGIHGMYSSEGEAIQSFPVEVQTDLVTSKNKTQDNVKPRFVYCKELNQDIFEEIDFVDLRYEQDEKAEVKRERIQMFEPRTDPSFQREPQAALVGPIEQIRREPGNLLDMFSLDDLDTATLVSEASSDEEDVDNYPQTPPSVSGFSVLCSPLFTFTSTATKPVPFTDIPDRVYRPPTLLSFDDSTWASESDEPHEMPGILDNVIDHMDRALGDFDDEEDTLDGESIFGPREYVRPIGLTLTPIHVHADAGTKPASRGSAAAVNHKVPHRQTVFEIIAGALWTKKRGTEERGSAVVKSDDNRAEGPHSRATNKDTAKTLGPWDYWDENDSLLDDDDDSGTYYTLSFSPRTDTTVTVR